MTDHSKNWGVFLNHWLIEPHAFAAQIVQTTAKTVTFDKSPGHADRSNPIKRSKEWLIISNLTEEKAKKLAELDKQSQARMESEMKAPKIRHLARRLEIKSQAHLEEHPLVGKITKITATDQWVKVISVEGDTAQIRQDFNDALQPVLLTELGETDE